MSAAKTESECSPNRKEAFREGVRHGLAVPSIVVFATMLGYGSLAHANGFSAFEALLSTALVWAMPGQVAMADLKASGADLFVTLLAVSMASVRFFPMATILVGTFRDAVTHPLKRIFIAHLMSASTWPMGMAAAQRMNKESALAYYWPVAGLCITMGCIGTLAGYWLSADMPAIVRLTLVFLNVVFLSLLFALNRDRLVILAVCAGAVIGPPLHSIEPNYGVILTGLIGGTLAYIILGRRR
ncbi:AzlC family ABC transporter permease [Nisaea nitritireducens]|uniref:AzlC family ABC transporter permease n=1 Tax=Nisaea nitritireducens TaxID=568392 RepID=UPI001866EF6A|nr:AzlC family ABC transporter permease [Nisaea nitritireducens]